MITISNIQSYAVVFVAILFVLEGGDRKRQSHYEAWQILDSAKDVETSYARLQALQDLNTDGVSLRGLDFPSTDLDGVELCQADLKEVDLGGASLRGADLSKTNLSGANLRNANLSSVIVSHGDKNSPAITKATNLAYADLTNVDLRGADLTGAILDHAWLHNTKIDQTTIIDPKWLLVWEIINNKLRATYLPGVDLSQANLTGVTLNFIDFEEADFSGANLTGVDFMRSYLVRANFKGAILKNADFTRACLRKSDLTQVDTRGTKFTDADLAGAKLGKYVFIWLKLKETRSANPTSVFAQRRYRDFRRQSQGRKIFNSSKTTNQK